MAERQWTGNIIGLMSLPQTLTPHQALMVGSQEDTDQYTLVHEINIGMRWACTTPQCEGLFIPNKYRHTLFPPTFLGLLSI